MVVRSQALMLWIAWLVTSNFVTVGLVVDIKRVSANFCASASSCFERRQGSNYAARTSIATIPISERLRSIGGSHRQFGYKS